MPETVLLADVGNTSVSLGLAAGSKLLRRRIVLPTHGCGRSAIRAAIMGLAAGRKLDGGILACVVPKVSQQWMAEMSAAAGNILAVQPGLRLDVELDYPDVETLGADRMVNASEAARRCGAPVIAADFGTATTFDVVSSGNAFIGGVILPGWPLMGEYLASRTARVPAVTAGDFRKFLKSGEHAAIGRNTVDAVCSGMFSGWRGIIREVVAAIRGDSRARKAALCVTGGFAPLAVAGLDIPFVMDLNLTLRGLARIYRLNKPRPDSWEIRHIRA